MKQTAGPTNIPYYTGIAFLFLLLKWGYTYSTNNHLLFLPAPTNTGIEMLTASKAMYMEAKGFSHKELGIVIDRSCSGFNFWLLAFTLLSLSTIHLYKNHTQKLFACMALLVISYTVTVFVNISRIAVALFTMQYKDRSSLLQEAWMHEAQGAFIYLLFLILLYIGIQSFTEKLTQTNAHAR